MFKIDSIKKSDEGLCFGDVDLECLDEPDQTEFILRRVHYATGSAKDQNRLACKAVGRAETSVWLKDMQEYAYYLVDSKYSSGIYRFNESILALGTVYRTVAH